MKDIVASVIKKYFQGTYSREVIRDVLRWLVSPENKEEKDAALHRIWDETRGDDLVDVTSGLNSVYSKVGVSPSDKQFGVSSWWMHGAAAAVLVLLTVGITLFISSRLSREPQIAEFYSSSTSIKKVTLPDGSVAEMNAGSHIFIADEFRGETRTVFLVGEACFKVKKDAKHPFIVKSATMSITALGTKFNVAAYPSSSSIVATLIEGSVKVQSESDRKTYLLSRGEQVIFDKNRKASWKEVADLEIVTAWQNGELIFRGATFEEILNGMEQFYSISFRYNVSRFNSDRYNFRINEGTSPEEALSILQLVTGGFKYKKEGNQYILY